MRWICFSKHLCSCRYTLWWIALPSFCFFLACRPAPTRLPAPVIIPEPISLCPESSPVQLTFRPVGRLPIPFFEPSSLSLAPPSARFTLAEDATDSLANLALAPDDVENGWAWALDVFQHLPECDRAPFIDQVAMLTPLAQWNRLDPILDQPQWGPEVQDRLFHRLLDLPLALQIPRLVRLAMNPYHPSSGKANALLQSYFPDIRPQDYPAYLGRMSQP